MEIRSLSTAETEKLAEQLANKVKKGDVIALYGELGSGKTTFVKYLVKHLGFANQVQSPTFVIAREYRNSVNETKNNIKKVNHLDLYRINNTGETMDLDLHQYLYDENAVTLIEWPEIIEHRLPEHTIKIRFNYGDTDGNERIINVQNIY